MEADRKFAAGRRSLRDAELVYMLAYTHGRTGNRGEAARLLAETVEIDPQHGDATTMLQRLKLGERSKSASLRVALQQIPR